MARAPKFATGSYAWGLCDICGFRYKLSELRETRVRDKPTGLLACPTDWDDDHPQNFLDKAVTVDPQALRNPRPQIDLGRSRLLYPPGNWLNGKPPGGVAGFDPTDFDPQGEDS